MKEAVYEPPNSYEHIFGTFEEGNHNGEEYPDRDSYQGKQEKEDYFEGDHRERY